MKILLAGTTLLSALVLSTAAHADPWDNPFYDRHHNYGHSAHRGSGYYRDFGHYRNRHDRGYRGIGRHYGRYDRGSYFSVSFGRGSGYYRSHKRHNYRAYKHRHHDFDGGALLGGIVLGSLISSSFNNYDKPHYETVRYRSRPVVRSRRVVEVTRPAPVRATPVTGRRLLRDLSGNCFEITRNSTGDELRVQVDASVCDY